ncbi:polysaccharide biosynthesis tyrosine autokinase [Chlorogloeopsis sp. ULAP02]|uniref:GumC family protein n=1 Tax=Chlorogloeopsis sp. ULAP02 TaxID=3107926 RepID=UPI003134CC58
MNSKQESSALVISERSDKLQQQRLVNADDFIDSNKRGLDLRSFGRMLQRNILLIGSIASFVAVITLYSILVSPRSYEGNFQILVEPVSSEGKLTDPSFISRNREIAPQTQVEINYPSILQILQGNELLERVAQNIRVKYPKVNYESIRKNLVVQRIGENMLDSTNIIDVTYKDSDPEKVEFILSEIAKEYLNFSLEDRKDRIYGGVKFIDAQLPQLQQRVSFLEGNLQRLQQRYNLSDPDSQVGELSKQVREIEAQKLGAQKELQENRRLYEDLQKQLRLTPNEALATSTLSQEPRYQELLAQLKKIETQIAIESAKYTESNPSLITLQQQQQNLSQLLNREAQNILGQKLTATVNPQLLNFQDPTRLGLIKQLVDTGNNVRVLESRLSAIAQSEAYLDQQVKQYPATMRQYNELKRQLEIATKTLNQFLLQRETLRVDAAQKEVPWKIVSQPRIPRDEQGNLIAKSGNLRRIVIGLAAATVLGLGAAFLKEKYRNVFHSPEEIKDGINLPILEVIPANQTAVTNPNSLKVVGAIKETEEDARFLSAFDSLYASVRFLAGSPKAQSIIVTSPAPGDGKSTVAMYLAQAAADMGKKTLLVDANFRNPSLHKKFALDNVQGLSNLISQDVSSQSFLIQASPLQKNLFVLTSGKILPSSTRMLGSAQMQHLMEKFRQAFDLVIYDTSHLLGFADVPLLAEHADGILMVVGVGKTKRPLITQALSRLQMLQLPVLGIIANHANTGKNSLTSSHNLHPKPNQRVLPASVKNEAKDFGFDRSEL